MWRISTLYLAAAVRDNGAGQAIATELSAVRARACADRSSQRGTEAARELGATCIHIDPTDDYSVEAAAARVRNEYRHLDVLINNAGTAAPRLGAEELTTDTEAPVRRACHCAEGDVLDTRGFIDLFAEDGEFTGIGGPSGPESYRGEHLGDVVVFMGKFLPGVHRELHRVSARGRRRGRAVDPGAPSSVRSRRPPG